MFGLEAIGSVAEVLKDLIQLFPNAEQRAKAAALVQNIEAGIAQQQSATNAEEAKSASLFVAGWRPFIGWVCGIGFVYQIVGAALHLPALDTSAMVPILFGMLGLGTMRTYEKVNGVPPSIVKKTK